MNRIHFITLTDRDNGVRFINVAHIVEIVHRKDVVVVSLSTGENYEVVDDMTTIRSKLEHSSVIN